MTIPRALNFLLMPPGGSCQAITRAIADQARTIRIPVHMVETINKVKKVSNQLLHKNGHEPTAEEIAKELDMAGRQGARNYAGCPGAGEPGNAYW